MPRAATAPAGSGFDAGPGQPAREYEITANDVFVRTHKMGLVNGTLFRGQHFIATHMEGAWVYGYAKGHADRPGWLLLGPSSGRGANGVRVGTAPTPHALDGVNPDLRVQDHIRYVPGNDRMNKPWDLSFPGRVRSGGMQLYANYRSGRGPADPALKLPAGTPIGLRYMVDDRWAMVQVKSTDSPDHAAHWLFARLEDLEVRDPKTAFAFLKNGTPVPEGYHHPRGFSSDD